MHHLSIQVICLFFTLRSPKLLAPTTPNLNYYTSSNAKSLIEFFIKQKFKHDLLLRIVERTKERFVFPSLEPCSICTIFFDLWMLKGGVEFRV